MVIDDRNGSQRTRRRVGVAEITNTEKMRLGWVLVNRGNGAEKN